jgi:hypothetical protein
MASQEQLRATGYVGTVTGGRIMIATIFDAIPDTRHERGFAGEFWARKMLERAGYTVERQTMRKSGDLLATDTTKDQSWKIEVKTAKRRPDGKFAFQLRVGNKTDCKHADYVLLVAVCGNGVVITYLIPVRVIGPRKTITLPKNLNLSKWSDYRVKGAARL